MAETASTMLPLGTTAPDFNLTDVVSGEAISLSIFKGKKALLVMFICKHCPYVKHVQKEIAQIAKDYQSQDIAVVAICSNDPQMYPEDAPGGIKQQAKEQGFTFPYCFDETQKVAKSYTAACTPDFFLFDKNRKLTYRGQLDASRPENGIPVTGGDLREAIEAMLNGKPVNRNQKPSLGCNIKWKVGNEPSYFHH